LSLISIDETEITSAGIISTGDSDSIKSEYRKRDVTVMKIIFLIRYCILVSNDLTYKSLTCVLSQTIQRRTL
ncbi:hypothetical protein, partial [Bacillus velezensis]|uniref:hypothetical protein n=1 Tax=Bacillus velezensis TaxID=492670 RepID=UPI001C529A97